jgi:hypothetical protein
MLEKEDKELSLKVLIENISMEPEFVDIFLFNEKVRHENKILELLVAFLDNKQEDIKNRFSNPNSIFYGISQHLLKKNNTFGIFHLNKENTDSIFYYFIMNYKNKREITFSELRIDLNQHFNLDSIEEISFLTDRENYKPSEYPANIYAFCFTLFIVLNICTIKRINVNIVEYFEEFFIFNKQDEDLNNRNCLIYSDLLSAYLLILLFLKKYKKSSTVLSLDFVPLDEELIENFTFNCTQLSDYSELLSQMKESIFFETLLKTNVLKLELNLIKVGSNVKLYESFIKFLIFYSSSHNNDKRLNLPDISLSLNYERLLCDELIYFKLLPREYYQSIPEKYKKSFNLLDDVNENNEFKIYKTVFNDIISYIYFNIALKHPVNLDLHLESENEFALKRCVFNQMRSINISCNSLTIDEIDSNNLFLKSLTLNFNYLSGNKDLYFIENLDNLVELNLQKLTNKQLNHLREILESSKLKLKFLTSLNIMCIDFKELSSLSIYSFIKTISQKSKIKDNIENLRLYFHGEKRFLDETISKEIIGIMKELPKLKYFSLITKANNPLIDDSEMSKVNIMVDKKIYRGIKDDVTEIDKSCYYLIERHSQGSGMEMPMRKLYDWNKFETLIFYLEKTAYNETLKLKRKPIFLTLFKFFASNLNRIFFVHNI